MSCRSIQSPQLCRCRATLRLALQCVLPDGVHLLPAPSSGAAASSGELRAGATAAAEPRTYSIVLTGGDGQRLFVSIIRYMVPPPALLACQHLQLAGHLATQALCLVSKRPYLATMEVVVRRLWVACFLTGSPAPLADVAAYLLAVPAPGVGQGDGLVHAVRLGVLPGSRRKRSRRHCLGG